MGAVEGASSAATVAPAILALDSPSDVKEMLFAMGSDEVRKLVLHCVHNEYAGTLEDLLQRRLGLLPFDYPGEQLRRSLAEQMAILLGWDQARTTRELQQADSLIAAGPVRSIASATPPATVIGS